ncbi:hypothetical protein AB205_0100830, partial [Aquarana catesbeiana]
MELSLRQAIETDVVDLRRHLDGLTLERCDLEFQLEHLAEDLLLLKKNHNEEVKNLEEQLGARVHVELDMAPAVDLQKNLSDIRNEYESLMDRNLNDVEKWFFTQLSALEGTLAETEESYTSKLAEIQELINNIQADLAQMRYDLELQNHEYKILTNVKTGLEMEIATYKQLMEGEDL